MMAEKIENLDNLVSTLKELNKSLEISARTLKQINNSKLALPVIKFADKLLCAVEECESAWRDICGKIEKRSQELVANIEGIFESLDNLEMGNSSNNNTSDDMETHLNTALAVFGFAGITLPDFLNGFTSAIKKLLAGGITLSDLLVSFGEFLISSPIGM